MSALKNKLKYYLGLILLRLDSRSYHSLSIDGITIDSHLNLRKRIIRYAILKKVEKQQDYNRLSALHTNYWKNRGYDFFRTSSDKFVHEFLPNYKFIFDLLKQKLSEDNIEYNTLVEIGSGNGKALNYLSQNLSGIKTFIGLDLSEHQVESNNETYKSNNNLKFIAVDGFKWIKEYTRSNTIVVTMGGVLEYFTQQQIKELLTVLKNLEHIQIITIEPVSNDQKVTDEKSIIFSPERTFSHNYYYLFQKAGFKIWHYSKKQCDSYTMIYMGASN